MLQQLIRYAVTTFLLCFFFQSGSSKVAKIPVEDNDNTIYDHPNGRKPNEACQKACTSDAIEGLTDLQKLELELNTFDIDQIEDIDEWLRNPDNQVPIVTLTSNQRQMIRDNFGELFTSQDRMKDKVDAFKELKTTKKEISAYGDKTGKKRKNSHQDLLILMVKYAINLFYHIIS